MRASAIGSADFGAGAGFEANLVEGFSLMGMGGAGIASHRDDRINWIAYFGVKWAFRAFGGAESSPE